MLGGKAQTVPEGSALVAGKQKETALEAMVAYKGGSHREPDPKAHLKCDYCGRTRHTRDRCFKLHPELRNSAPNDNSYLKEDCSAKNSWSKF